DRAGAVFRHRSLACLGDVRSEFGPELLQQIGLLLFQGRSTFPRHTALPLAGVEVADEFLLEEIFADEGAAVLDHVTKVGNSAWMAKFQGPPDHFANALAKAA